MGLKTQLGCDAEPWKQISGIGVILSSENPSINNDLENIYPLFLKVDRII